MSTKQRTYTLGSLPLASKTLQNALPELSLEDKPTAQRRSTTFKRDTGGIWARVNPLWTSWPLRITKDDLLEMGVDVDQGQQISVEDVLARWDPVDPISQGVGEEGGVANGASESSRAADLHSQSDTPTTSPRLGLRTSKHRSKINPILLGISPKALVDTLPHLDVGDALDLCSAAASCLNPSVSSTSTKPSGSAAREELVDLISGRKVLSGDGYGPWSTRYCGHQFGVWAGQLGDGRAISILETESPAGRTEIQLKGAGRTPFSRQADGLAVLRSGVREFLGCEGWSPPFSPLQTSHARIDAGLTSAVAALGIPSTRSLALLTSPDVSVLRENGEEPPSVLARLAPSFIRIGHFEALNPGSSASNTRQVFFGGGWVPPDEPAGEGPLGGEGNLEALGKLTRWCMHIKNSVSAADWLREVVRRNAEMVAKWQVYGFCHGVLNSDNISVLGLTIDYGPYAFMDVFNESHICNHSDPTGLYSYKNHPSRVLFALDKLVSAVAPLVGYEAEHGDLSDNWAENATKGDVERWAEKAETTMGPWEDEYWNVEKAEEKRGWMSRFGLKTTQKGDDRDIILDFLTNLRTHGLDLNIAFRHLSHFAPGKAAEPEYIKSFLGKLAEEGISDKRNDAVRHAVEGMQGWMKLYAERASSVEEQSAWGGKDEWEETRRNAMLDINPRFVLRQWVLEELISQLEAIDLDNEESIAEGRRRLAKVLEMSTNPFEAYGEEGGSEEEARLCGMGSTEMLGFQCSCSS